MNFDKSESVAAEACHLSRALQENWLAHTVAWDYCGFEIGRTLE